MRRSQPIGIVLVAIFAVVVGSSVALLVDRTKTSSETAPPAAPERQRGADGPRPSQVVETPAAFVVASLGSAAWLAPDGVRALRFLPDGTGIVTADENRIRILPLPDGRPVREVELQKSSARESEHSPADPWDARAAQEGGLQFCVAVAESGRTLVLSRGRLVQAVDATNGVVRAKIAFKGIVKYVGAPACANRVVVRADGGLREWTIGSSDTSLLTVCGAVWAASDITGLAVAQVPGAGPNGVDLAVLDDSGRVVGTLTEPPQGPWAVAFSPDGTRLAWLCGTRREVTAVRVALVSALADATTYKPPAPDVRRLRWRDGRTLVLGRAKNATAFDVDAGEARGECADWDYPAAFSSDGRLRARVSRSRLLVEDVTTGNSAVPDPGPRAMERVAFRPRREEFACADADGAVDLVDARSGRVVRRLDGPGDYVWSLAFDEGGDRLVVDRNGSSIDVLDVAGRTPAVRRRVHGCFVTFAGGRPLALTGKHDGPWRCISLDDGAETVLPDAGRELPPTEFGVSTDGGFAAGFGGSDGLLAWDLARAEVVARYPTAREHGRVYLSDGARRIVVLGAGLRAFDAAHPDAAPLDLGSAPRSATPNPDCAISPDGRWFAARDGDDVVVWSLSDGRRRAALRGCTTDTFRLDLAFSHDGRLLAAGPEVPGVGCVWDVEAATR